MIDKTTYLLTYLLIYSVPEDRQPTANDQSARRCLVDGRTHVQNIIIIVVVIIIIIIIVLLFTMQ